MKGELVADTRCIVCDGSKLEVFIKHQNFVILHCIQCGLFFQGGLHNTFTLEELYNNIYSEGVHTYLNKRYYNLRMGTQFNDITDFRKSNSISEKVSTANAQTSYEEYGNTITNALACGRYKKQPGILLEIGCSYGFMLEYFITRGWKAVGIDISKNAIQYAQSKCLDCYNVALENFIPPKKFDVIIMSNVLEHLKDPIGCLQLIKDWLNEEGMIYIRVPNVESIVLPSKRRSFIGDLKPFEHFFYFNKDNLKMLFDKAGLKSTIKTDGSINLCNVLNCYFRSKIVLKQSWQDLNSKTKPEQKRLYLLAKHLYGEILTFFTFIPLGPQNRELVAFVSLDNKIKT